MSISRRLAAVAVCLVLSAPIKFIDSTAGTIVLSIGSLKDLHAGQLVTISGEPRPNGPIHAATVAAGGAGTNAAADVSIFSITVPVKSVDPDADTFVISFARPVFGADGHTSVHLAYKDTTVFVDGNTKLNKIANLKDVHPGDSLNVTAEKRPDGNLHALRLSR